MSERGAKTKRKALEKRPSIDRVGESQKDASKSRKELGPGKTERTKNYPSGEAQTE